METFSDTDFLMFYLDGAPVGTTISAAMDCWPLHWSNHNFTKDSWGRWVTDGISRYCDVDGLTNVRLTPEVI